MPPWRRRPQLISSFSQTGEQAPPHRGGAVAVMDTWNSRVPRMACRTGNETVRAAQAAATRCSDYHRREHRWTRRRRADSGSQVATRTACWLKRTKYTCGSGKCVACVSYIPRAGVTVRVVGSMRATGEQEEARNRASDEWGSACLVVPPVVERGLATVELQARAGEGVLCGSV